MAQWDRHAVTIEYEETPVWPAGQHTREECRVFEILKEAGVNAFTLLGGAHGHSVFIAGPEAPAVRKRIERAIQDEGLRVKIT